MSWEQVAPKTLWDGNRARWMSQLPDTLAVQDMSVPGTHDSAALQGFTHDTISETQQWRIDEQLNNGIRFLDLRVKIMFRHRGLAMYHGIDAIYDYYKPNSLDQLYYKTVIGKCVEFLKQNPNEAIIISVKCEGDTEYDGVSIEDWFRRIANEVAADNPPGTWDRWWDYRSSVNATLKDLRGKLLFWRRFPRGGRYQGLNYTDPFALDLTPLNDKYDNTKAADWYTPVGGYSYVQDNYSGAAPYTKFVAWYNTMIRAHDTRWMPSNPDNRQYINFSSIGGTLLPRVTPKDYAEPMNAMLHDWLSAMESGRDEHGNDLGGQKVRSGTGVVPMDFPTQGNIDILIRANFGWTYRLWTQGELYLSSILRAHQD